MEHRYLLRIYYITYRMGKKYSQKDLNRHSSKEDTHISKKAYHKTFNTISHHGNLGQKHNEIPLYTRKDGYNKMLLRIREIKTLIHCSGNLKMVQPLWKTAWQFLKKLKSYHLTYLFPS